MSTFQMIIGTLAEGADFLGLLVKLGRAELLEQVAKAGRGSALCAISALGLLFAVALLLMGVVELIIAYGVAAYVACFATGGALAFISVAMGLAGRAYFRALTLRPELMLDQIRRLSTEAATERHLDEQR